MDKIKELKIIPREYQQAIFKTCIGNNCLVVLPTGTGKTLIAIMLSIERFKKFPLKKVLILAPTRPLVEQHFESFKKNLPEDWADLQLFTGKTPADKRKKIWQTAEFIFSTPQCISNDLKNNLYNLEDISLLIVDECHRCLKNYSYNFITQKYKQQAVEDESRVLGLTASPGGDKETIKIVCQNLGIEKVEIRTRESEDVKPHLQDLEFEKIEVDFPSDFEEIRQLLKMIYEEKIQILKNQRILFGFGSKTLLLKAQIKISNDIKKTKDPSLYSAASTCAQALKISHAVGLLETQTLSSFIEYCRDLYKQSAEKKSRGVQKLTSDLRFSKAFSLAQMINHEHPKLEELKELMKEQFQKNPNSKIIIFGQFRETVRKITEELNKFENIRAKTFVGQAIKSHGTDSKGNEKTTGLKQSEQKEIIREFSQGKINVLIATSIAEEGLDIPEVDEVIFYEPVPSAIRKIQRAGRTARLSKGSLKIMITKNTQDQTFHYVSQRKEKKMHQAIDEIKRNLNIIKEKQEELF